jgi:S1-C subfamily serine protease
VKGCASIVVSPKTLDIAANVTARLLASDPTNDLAVLATAVTPSVVPEFNSGIRVGDNIFVYGFPLPGLLASSGNFTTGNVTATAGIRDNTSLFQISAPVQPGNSGGPLVDEFGNVAGVIVSKLDVIRVANITDDVVQNVNFAIKASIAENFLESNGLAPVVATSKQRIEPASIAELAKRFTVKVICHDMPASRSAQR